MAERERRGGGVAGRTQVFSGDKGRLVSSQDIGFSDKGGKSKIALASNHRSSSILSSLEKSSAASSIVNGGAWGAKLGVRRH